MEESRLVVGLSLVLETSNAKWAESGGGVVGGLLLLFLFEPTGGGESVGVNERWDTC